MGSDYDAQRAKHADLADHATTADTADTTRDEARRALAAGMRDGATNLAEAVAHAEQRSDWQDKVAKDREKTARAQHSGLAGRVQSLTWALVIGCLAVGIIGMGAAYQGGQARSAAAEARSAATCSKLLDEAVAMKEVGPELRDAGCDVRLAETVVRRIQERDDKVAATEKALAEQRTLIRDATCRVLLVLDPEPTDVAVVDLRNQLRCP